MPTKVLMGHNVVRQSADLISVLGKKALIVTGARSAEASGALDDVTAALKQNRQSYLIFNKVMSNPTIACVYDGADAAKREGCDFVVAVGGGSPMDAAKAIALLVCQDIPQSDLFSGRYGGTVLPMAHIPTTAGTGSEVTPYAILTNDAAQTKTSLASPLLFPNIAMLDARYLKALPHTVAVCTAIDALSHLTEGMLTVRSNMMTDMLATEGIKNIAYCLGALKNGLLTDEQREKLLYASMLGGMVISNCGTTAVHAMGYSLTYFKNVEHGRANGLLLAAFFEFLQKNEVEKVSRILELMGLKSVDELKITLDELLGEMDPLSEQEIVQYSRISINTKNIGNTLVPPTERDIADMFRASL